MNGNWRFEEGHLRSWARFSGDFNPIHFDLEKARLAGSPAIIVHGMLPLLYVKREVTRRIHARSAIDDGLKIKCRLKTPLQRDAHHEFRLMDNGRGGRFSLADSRGGPELVQGMFSGLVPLVPGESIASIDVPATAIHEKLFEFSTLFPEIKDLWIAIDGLAFAEFLGAGVLLRLASSFHMDSSARDQDELMQRTLALQTTHAVSVAPWLLARRIEERRQIGGLQLRLAEPVLVCNRDTELTGSETFDVFVDDELALQCDVGFILKLPDPSKNTSQPTIAINHRGAKA